MELRPLGSSGLLVSPICLGTMTFGTPVPEADAIRLVHESIEMGINFIDTANVYEGYDRVLGSAGGVAEEITGKAIADRRDQVILATKVGGPLGQGPQDRGLSAVHIQREVEASLRRLNTDVIDLYIIHWPDRFTPLEATLQALDRIVRQGKARCIGVSNHSAAQLCQLLWLAEKHDWVRPVASQIPFSFLRRDFQHELPFCEEFSIGVTPYQSLQGGLLTGKYRRGEEAPEGSRGAEKPEWVWERDDAMFDSLVALEAPAAEIDTTPARYALAWTLAQPAMSSLVVGAKRIDQVADAVAAAELTIPPEHFARIDEIVPPPWHQPDPIR